MCEWLEDPADAPVIAKPQPTPVIARPQLTPVIARLKAYPRHREAAGRGDPWWRPGIHGLPRCARNDGKPPVIARLKAYPRHREAAAYPLVIARLKAVAIHVLGTWIAALRSQ